MQVVGALADSVTALVAVVAASIALLQLRHGRKDARAARTAELSWSIYQAYDSVELRKGRQSLELVSRSLPAPSSGREFGEMYRIRTYRGPNEADVRTRAEEISRTPLRPILRYYQQVGILLEQGLIDADFIFPMIGYALETSALGIKVSVDWYQNFYGGESGSDQAPRRLIYEKSSKLVEMHRVWKLEQS